MTTKSILWRRIDVPGHDACRLEHLGGGWSLHGAAVFREHDVVTCLVYQVTCDVQWRTRGGSVQGWIGARRIELRIDRGANGEWTLNGDAVPNLEDCLDLDLGFTPATNLFQLRRIALDAGQAAGVPVAWLDVNAGTLEVLHQRYERRSGDTYWYEAPRFDYAAVLAVHPVGFVGEYPGLWVEEREVPSTASGN